MRASRAPFRGDGSTSHLVPSPERAKPGSSLFPMEWLLGWPEGSRAKRCPGSGPLPASRVSATHPNPAWRPKQPNLWPLFLQPCTRPSRGTRQILPVVPLIPDKRYYGEYPVRLRRYARAVGDTVPPIPPKTVRTHQWRWRCARRCSVSAVPLRVLQPECQIRGGADRSGAPRQPPENWSAALGSKSCSSYWSWCK
jgi:hypothetical protein